MAEDNEDMVELNTELLAQLEEEAASRYTQEDTLFKEHCNKGLPKPPILPAEIFDRNRQRRGNFRHQDYRRGGDFRDHRRQYSDHRHGGRFGSNHRDHEDDRRDHGKRQRSERENNEYGRRHYEPSKHYHGGSS